MLRAAARPDTGARLARLRASEIRLAAARPRPTVIVVLATAPGLGTSGFAALLAQTLQGIAPSRVAVLDCDGINQPQRRKLAASAGGDVRQMLSSRSSWRIRRAVDRHLCPDAIVSLFAAAATGPATAFNPAELLAAVRLIGRRYPVVLVDVPVTLTDGAGLPLVQAADHVAVVLPAGTSPAPMRTWVETVRPGLAVTAVWSDGTATIDANANANAATATVADNADVSVPMAELVGAEPARLVDVRLSVLAAVQEVAVRATSAWPRLTCPTQRGS